MENFEKWVNTHKKILGEDVTGLLSDSLRCMNNGIYRAAYLLAYQGMMLSLRNKILNGSKPKGFDDGEWENIKKNICNENKWDANTFDQVVRNPNPQKSKAAILNMRQDIRKQFEHWRYLRNICAHYKDTKFIPAHVLTLYSFIGSHLDRISVEGSKEDLLEEFRSYCDKTKYSQSTSLAPLINKISQMVEPVDMKNFLLETLKIIDDSDGRNLLDFIKNLYYLDGIENEKIRQCTKEILHDNERLKRDMAEKFIEMSPLLYNNPVEARELWSRYIYDIQYPLDVFEELINSDIIPVEEVEEVFNSILSNGHRHGRYLEVKDPRKIRLFENQGYFDLFIDKYLNAVQINKMPGLKTNNYNTDFYISHLSIMKPTPHLVSAMLEVFSPGKNVPFTLKDRIKNEIWTDENFKKQFIDIAHDTKEDFPENFLN